MMQTLEAILCVGRLYKEDVHLHRQECGGLLGPGLSPEEPEPEDPGYGLPPVLERSVERKRGRRRRRSERGFGRKRLGQAMVEKPKEMAVQTEELPKEMIAQTEEVKAFKEEQVSTHERLESIEQALWDLVNHHSQATRRKSRKSAPAVATEAPCESPAEGSAAAGNAVKPLPPLRLPSGKSWEWPQARHEKKERAAMLDKRILMTDRRSLLQELEEVHKHHALRADKVLQSCASRSWEWPMSRNEKKSRLERLDRQAVMVDHSDVLFRLGALLDTARC